MIHKLLRAQAHSPQREVCLTEENKPAHLFLPEVCARVYVALEKSPSALFFARYLCLVNPLRAPSHRVFILLSVVSLLSLHTHTHTNTHKCTYTHSKSCVSIYLDVIVCNIIKFCKYNLPVCVLSLRRRNKNSKSKFGCFSTLFSPFDIKGI